jgi:hypothetical protein
MLIPPNVAALAARVEAALTSGRQGDRSSCDHGFSDQGDIDASPRMRVLEKV